MAQKSQNSLLNALQPSQNDCWDRSSSVEALLIVNHVLYSNYGFTMIWIMPEFCSRPFEIKHENISFLQPRHLIPQYDTHGCYTVIAERHFLSREQFSVLFQGRCFPDLLLSLIKKVRSLWVMVMWGTILYMPSHP